ncbi:MAG TPA: adenylosuccinate synthetase [Nitrososphaeraceae archaeon]|nr:adenylosuccinate synthetase [Nitrososphaeraceae archaeon]
MPCIVVVGGFYGDEGKGKVIAYLAKKDNCSIAVRGGVGPNAGHTFVDEGKMYKVRMLPSAALNRSTRLLIGPGVLINPEILLKEIKMFNASDRTFIDTQCGIIDQKHIEKDNLEDHLKGFIGNTGSGTGPANADRAFRLLKLAREVDALSLYLEDVSSSVNYSLENKENVIVEGTQGTFLSLYYGDYPYVTSKDVTASGICSDVGIGPKKVDEVLVVFKSYVTRVGGGPLQDEVTREESEKRGWLEYGSVTGRERRSSPFDMNLAKKAIRLNSATQIAITKLDVIFPETRGIREFNKLSEKAKEFIENIEADTGIKVTLIGTGAELNDIIDRRI